MPSPAKPDIVELHVFDTNTFMSAAIRQKSVPAQAVVVAATRGRLIFSEETLAELREVLTRPKFDRYAPLSVRAIFMARLIDDAVLLPTPPALQLCRDPKDDKFLSLAHAAGASYLITGDADLLAHHPFGLTQILTPRSFLDLPA